MDEKLEGIWEDTIVVHLYTNIPAFTRTYYREEKKSLYRYIHFKTKIESYTFQIRRRRKRPLISLCLSQDFQTDRGFN